MPLDQFFRFVGELVRTKGRWSIWNKKKINWSATVAWDSRHPMLVCFIQSLCIHESNEQCPLWIERPAKSGPPFTFVLCSEMIAAMIITSLSVSASWKRTTERSHAVRRIIPGFIIDFAGKCPSPIYLFDIRSGQRTELNHFLQSAVSLVLYGISVARTDSRNGLQLTCIVHILMEKNDSAASIIPLPNDRW